MFTKLSLFITCLVTSQSELVKVYPESAPTHLELVNSYGTPIYETPVEVGYGNEYGYGGEHDGGHYSYPKYQFSYGVNDPHTGDHKSQAEERDGDVVKGYYTVADPDGTLRTVHYTADDHNGFNALVEKSGHAIHPVEVVEKVIVEPLYEKPIYQYGIGNTYGQDYQQGYKQGLGYY